MTFDSSKIDQHYFRQCCFWLKFYSLSTLSFNAIHIIIYLKCRSLGDISNGSISLKLIKDMKSLSKL